MASTRSARTMDFQSTSSMSNNPPNYTGLYHDLIKGTVGILLPVLVVWIYGMYFAKKTSGTVSYGDSAVWSNTTKQVVLYMLSMIVFYLVVERYFKSSYTPFFNSIFKV
jgi:hypothetical protein